MTQYTCVDSPIGMLLLLSDGQHLTGLYMDVAKYHAAESWSKNNDLAILQETTRQLAEYFEGARQVFDLPIKPAGTEFQRQVWEELCNIPYGTVISYGQLARTIGKPKAFRAVGLANSKNPISIIVPCHRVIGGNGTLTGYGGGLPRKKALLLLEGGQQHSAKRFHLPCPYG